MERSTWRTSLSDYFDSRSCMACLFHKNLLKISLRDKNMLKRPYRREELGRVCDRLKPLM